MPNFSAFSSNTYERSAVTLASTTPAPSRDTKPRSTNSRHRREVTTMLQRLQAVLSSSRKPAPRPTAPFNGALLDQRREDVVVSLHRLGNFR